MPDFAPNPLWRSQTARPSVLPRYLNLNPAAGRGLATNPYWTGDQDPYTQALPTVMDVQGEVEEQRTEQPWWNRIFEFMDQLTFGQTVKGILHGAAKGPWEAIVEGVRNLPFLYYGLGKELQAADVREAWGDTNARSGWKNIVLNTVGDIAMSPGLMFGIPFGVVKGAGAAARAGAEAGALIKAGGTAAEGAAGAIQKGMAAGLAEQMSLKIGMETGKRALWTFKLPWMDKELFAIGQNVPGRNPFGFGSFGISLGGAIDRFFGTLHSHPALRPLAGFFTFATGIADPKKRGIFAKATREAQTVAIYTMQTFKEIMEASTASGFREFLLKNPQANDALMTLAQTYSPKGIQSVSGLAPGQSEIQHTLEEFPTGTHGAEPFKLPISEGGVLELDQRGQVGWIVQNPHLAMGMGKRDSLLRNDPAFLNAWSQAQEELLQPVGMSTPAIQYLYEKYPTIPLPADMLNHAGLSGRYGAEFSIFDKPSYAEELMSIVGHENATPGMVARAQSGAEARQEMIRVRDIARDKTMKSYDALQQGVKDGKFSNDDLKTYLTGRYYAMEAMSKMETIGGILGATMEPAVGPYVHRVANPALLKLIDDQFIRGVKRAHPKGMNIVSSFMKDPSYSSLTVAEANAMFWEFGTKLLNYQPLKDIVSGAEHSVIDRMKAKIFDLPFIKALKKEGHYDAANFFLTNPVLNDYTRFWESAGQQGIREMFKILRDSPMATRVSGNDPQRIEKILKHELELNEVGVIFHGTPGQILETQGGAQMVAEAWSRERTAQANVARGQIRNDVESKIALQTSIPVSEYQDMQRAIRSVNADASDQVLRTADEDNLGVAVLKMKAREHKLARRKIAALEVLEGSTEKGLDRMAADLRKIKKPNQNQKQFLYEYDNLSTKWESEGVITREEIRARVGQNVERRANVALQLDAEMKRIEGVMNLPDQVGDTGYAFKVNELRLRDMLEELDKRIEADRGFLTNKYKDRATYMSRSVADDLEKHRVLSAEMQADMTTYREALREEAAQFRTAIDQTAAVIKSEGKLRRSEITHARNRRQLAMDMNREVNALYQSYGRGDLALHEVGAEMKEKIVQSNHDIYFFPKEDWAAITRFHDHFTHPDDWGTNRIVQALRAMKNVWAPYTAANPFGVQTMIRNFVTNHLMMEFGGMQYRSASYKHAAGITRGLRKVHDKEMTAEEFAATPLKLANPHPDLPKDLTYGDIVPYIQSRAILNSAGFMGEHINHGADMLALSRRAGKSIRQQIADEPWKLIQDLPSALFPYKRPEDSIWGQIGLKMASGSDDVSRLAGFVDALHRGHNLQEAADWVGKWTYDSRRNLTTLERQRLSTFIPFYSFAKFATARSVETFLKRPGSIAWINSFRDNAFKSVYAEKDADPADLDLVMPKFISKAFGVPYRNGEKGPEFFMLGSFLPQQYIMQIAAALEGFGQGLGPGMASVTDFIGENLHPAIKVAIESARNRSFYQGDEIEVFPGQTDEFFGMAIPRRGMLWSSTMLRQFKYVWNINKHNLLGLSEANALRHGLPIQDEPAYLERYATSAFGVLPLTGSQNISATIRHMKRKAEQELGSLSALFKNRLERGGVVGDADAAELGKQLTQKIARLARIEDVERNAYPPEEMPKRRPRRKIGKLNEELAP